MTGRLPMILLLVLPTLAGCAERFVRAGVTSQQANADLYQCQRENFRYDDGTVSGAFALEDMTRQCMRARGYSTP